MMICSPTLCPNDLQTALIPVGAVHGSGNKRYVYMATERSNVLGAPDLIITKIDISVIDEAEGFVAVNEKLAHMQLVYMEDRPLSDGCIVMEKLP